MAPPQGIVGMSRLLLASSSYRPGMLLDVLEMYRTPPPPRHTHTEEGIIQPQRMRSPGLTRALFYSLQSISQYLQGVPAPYLLPERMHCHPPHPTAVRSDPVTAQPPTLRGPHCAWQNCKLLPVAFEALLDRPCWPWPHLLALASPVGLGLTCCLLYQLTVHPLASRQPLAPCG